MPPQGLAHERLAEERASENCGQDPEAGYHVSAVQADNESAR